MPENELRESAINVETEYAKGLIDDEAEERVTFKVCKDDQKRVV